MRVLPRVKRRWRWLAAFIFLLWLAVLAADRLWPLPLHDVTPARVVVAEDGTPLWRFADAQGVWRYPVTLADVSPWNVPFMTASWPGTAMICSAS